MSDWQPIETAPKKRGKRILIFDMQEQQVIAAWDGEEWELVPQGGLALFVTHWMRLPEPPQ